MTLTNNTNSSASALPAKHTCDSVKHGYNCESKISHYWGEYSPYFTIPSDISPDIPDQCTLTFAQVLSRHGARDPTAKKTASYATLVNNTKKAVKDFPSKYAFLANYTYTLGADDLTTFGQQEMVNSGDKFYGRYKSLARKMAPFVRSSGEARVVESAMNFTQGFHDAVQKDSSRSQDTYPYPILVIPEADGTNNTLNHGLCTNFENGTDSTIADSAQKKFLKVFGPAIQTRLNNDLKGANFSLSDVVSFMDLCPFNTVASPTGVISPFCDLFTEDEWHSYDYYQSLGKFYGYGLGNPLGPTQGVGFINELIARLTNSAVVDHTSTNSTLDSDNATFPTDHSHVLFADFSHDNDITGILSAMGVYNDTKMLSNTTVETTDDTNGYSASWTVPFAARVYVEKMTCKDQSDELVRVIVNDRVLPLDQCCGDKEGRCVLSDFIDSLSFAKQGGLWSQCFAS